MPGLQSAALAADDYRTAQVGLNQDNRHQFEGVLPHDVDLECLAFQSGQVHQGGARIRYR